MVYSLLGITLASTGVTLKIDMDEWL